MDDRHARLEQTTRDSLAHYKHLTYTIDALAAVAATVFDDAVRKKLQEGFQALRESSKGINDYLSLTIQPKYYNERRAENCTMAARVLAIPELLEQILEQASLNEVLNMCQVNKELKAIVDASPQLQIKLGYKAVELASFAGGERSSPFVGLCEMICQFSVSVSKFDFQDDINVHAGFWNVGTAKDLPSIGACWRRMLICQPPIFKMEGFLQCSWHGSSTDRTMPTIISDTGITIGDLNDEAAKILGDENACRDCRTAPPTTAMQSMTPTRLDSEPRWLQVLFHEVRD